jgi:hypothetical protein
MPEPLSPLTVTLKAATLQRIRSLVVRIARAGGAGRRAVRNCLASFLVVFDLSSGREYLVLFSTPETM